MTQHSDVELDLFEAFLAEDDEGAARLLAAVLGIDEPPHHIVDLVVEEAPSPAPPLVWAP